MLDETDSGLDIDALRFVSQGANQLAKKDNTIVLVTFYQRLINYIVPDFVHLIEVGHIIRKLQMDAETLIQKFLAMATGKLDLSNPSHIGRHALLTGVCNLSKRVKSAILPWHTLHTAFNSVISKSTETDVNPMHLPTGNA